MSPARTPRKKSTPGPKKVTKRAPVDRRPRMIGDVLALRLGHDGLLVETESQQYTVDAAVPGDRLRIAARPRPLAPKTNAPRSRPTKTVDHRDVQRAEIDEVLTPAPTRVEPPCAVVQRCGGCALQQMSYEGQLQSKTATLRANLAPLAGSEDAVADVVGLSTPFGYRTKLMMVAGGHTGGLRFGFYRRGSTELVTAEGCPVQHPLTLSVLAMVTQVLNAHGVPPSETHGTKGWLHGVGIRVEPSKGLAEVALFGRTPRLPGKPRLAERLTALPGIHSLFVSVNPTRSSYLAGQEYKLMAGARRTPFVVAGETFVLSPGTFLQTCPEAADLLVAQVLESLPTRIRCLADLYGGAGLFARLAASRWQRAIVAESSSSAVDDLHHALKHQKLSLSAISGPLEQTIDRVLAHRPDVVLVDPPRRGCRGPVIQRIGAAKPKRVVYVACSVEALVGDGLKLREAGYRLRSVSAVDMFPHTTHVEVVARFDR